jgi:hypothetical protein
MMIAEKASDMIRGRPALAAEAVSGRSVAGSERREVVA